MVDLLISAGMVLVAGCSICLCASIGIYLHAELQQARVSKAARPPSAPSATTGVAARQS